MRFLSVLIFFVALTPKIVAAQPSPANVSRNFSVEGEIVATVDIVLDSLQTFGPVVSVDSLTIYSHDMKPRHTIHKLQGVLLKNVLSVVKFKVGSPKELSSFYFVCEATDGYKVIFSWNELYNTAIGNQAMVIISEEGKPAVEQKDHIALVSPADRATGRRYVKWLSRITVSRVK